MLTLRGYLSLSGLGPRVCSSMITSSTPLKAIEGFTQSLTSRPYGIIRDAYKLARTSIIIKKKKKNLCFNIST